MGDFLGLNLLSSKSVFGILSSGSNYNQKEEGSLQVISGPTTREGERERESERERVRKYAQLVGEKNL